MIKARLFAKYMFIISGVVLFGTYDQLGGIPSVVISIAIGAVASWLWVMLRYRGIACSQLSGKTPLEEIKLKSDYGSEPVITKFYTNNMSSITIPESVTCIHDLAFHDSTLLKITIHKNVVSIGSSAFEGCLHLTNITVSPDNQSYSSQDGVLYNKDKTELIHYPRGKTGDYTIPNSLTSIGDWAFFHCQGLSEITIPDGVTSIGNSAFYGCTGLKSVTVPDGVTTIGDGAFGGCSNLTSFYIPVNVSTIGKGTFSNCTKLIDISIHDAVISIGDYAFQNCERLSRVVIGNSVSSIGALAFTECANLANITVSPDNQSYSSQDGVLLNKAQTEIIYFPKGKVGAYNIPDRVTSIKERMFLFCASLTSVTISDSVTSIGDGAFLGCKHLSSIIIPDSVISIGGRAFEDCSSLVNVAIPDSVISIGDEAFHNCRRLDSILVGNMVTCIKPQLFLGCSRLAGIILGNSVSAIALSAFADCANLANITVSPDNQSYSSQDGVLYNKDKTEIIYFPKGKAGAYTIPEKVTRIDQKAFYGCWHLIEIIIPDSVVSIGDAAFCNCTSLSSVTIGEGVTSISNALFGGCINLIRVTMARRFSGFGHEAFRDCYRLDGINVKGEIFPIPPDEIGFVTWCPKQPQTSQDLDLNGTDEISHKRDDGNHLIFSPDIVTRLPKPGRHYPCGKNVGEGQCDSLFDYNAVHKEIVSMPMASSQFIFPMYDDIWGAFDDHYDWLYNMYGGHVYGRQGDQHQPIQSSVLEPCLHYLEYCERSQSLAEYQLLNLLSGFTALQAVAAYCLDRVMHNVERITDVPILYELYPGRFYDRFASKSAGHCGGDEVGQNVYVQPLAPCTRRCLNLKTAPDWIAAGNSSLAKGDYLFALLAYDFAIEINSNSSIAWYNKGVALHQLGLPEYALISFEKAIDLDPAMEHAACCKNTVLLQKKQRDDALCKKSGSFSFYQNYIKSLNEQLKGALSYTNEKAILQLLTAK